MIRRFTQPAALATPSATRSFFLAFNPGCKARPNFGLNGVGYYTSTTYHSKWQTVWGISICALPIATLYVLWFRIGIMGFVDEIAGGGPREMSVYEFGLNQHADKPWHFTFQNGEGYKHYGPGQDGKPVQVESAVNLAGLPADKLKALERILDEEAPDWRDRL